LRRQEVDLIVAHAAEIVTTTGRSLHPASGPQQSSITVIQDGAIAVRRGRIVQIGKTREILSAYRSKHAIDASGKTALPGLVDPHTHLIFAGFRDKEFEMKLSGKTYMEILAAGGGILSTVRETRRTGKHRLFEICRERARSLLLHGTTTIEAKSGYGLNTAEEIKCLQVARSLDRLGPFDVVPTFLGAHAIPEEYEGRADEYVDLVIEEMIPKIAEKKLARFCDVFCEKGVFTVEQSRRILEAARQRGLKSKIHADEFADTGGAALAAEIGAVSADHLLCSSDEGLGKMAGRGTVAVLLPAAPLTLMTSRYANARKMIEHSVPVAIGTDLSPSCMLESQQMSIALACHFMRMTPAEAIVAATINAAHAICEASSVGSLEPSKKADIAIIDAPNHRFLGYKFGVNLVETVIKDGKIVVQDHHLV
jgi:imidazolonepropionase